MKTLEDAIFNLFGSTSALATAIVGGLWKDEAPKRIGYPFMVFEILAAPLDQGFGWKRYTATVAFTLAGANRDDQEANMKIFTDTFDGVTLTVVGGNNFDTIRLDEPMAMKATDSDGTEIKDQDNKQVYQIVTHYQFSVA